MLALRNITRHAVRRHNMATWTEPAEQPCSVDTEKADFAARLRQKVMGEVAEDIKMRRDFDPSTASILLFPGQGAQYVGMGRDLLRFPGARDIYEMANEILNFDLLKLCLEGPRATLNRAEYAQLAVMVTSLASLEKLREERPAALGNCLSAAGFSDGEITALTFAGAIPFDKALRLVQVRAMAMQKACEETPGGLALVFYKPSTDIKKACRKAMQWCAEQGIEKPYCGIANYMYEHCKVIGGHTKALEYLEQHAGKFHFRQFKMLNTTGAYHTPLMASAVEPVQRVLSTIEVQRPLIHVISNFNAIRYQTPQQIVQLLPKNIVQPVKWEQVMHKIYERPDQVDFPRTFECGPGRGLTLALEKINLKASKRAVSLLA